MTLKCIQGGNQHCNQVNFESPLLYLDGFNTHPRRNKRQNGWESQEPVIVEGTAHGWFCGPTPVPTDYMSVSVSHRTMLVGGNPPNTQNSFGEPDGVAESGVSRPTPTTLTKTETDMLTASQTPDTTSPMVPSEVTDLNRGQMGDLIDYDCDLDIMDEDDCYFEDCVAVLEDPCFEDCEDLSYREGSLPQSRCWNMFCGSDMIVTTATNTITFVSEKARPMTTLTPAVAPVMINTEGIYTISTRIENQSQFALFKATRSWNLVPPTQNVTFPQSTNKSNPSDTSVAPNLLKNNGR